MLMSILNLLVRSQGQLTLDSVPYQGSFSTEAMRKCKAIIVSILLLLLLCLEEQIL